MLKFEYQPGTTPVANYTIQYALGRGGFGEVYFATSPAGREVALKAILNHEEVEIRGVQNCMNLDSPRLVTIFDICRDDDQVPWVVMEYIRGPSLSDILKQSPDGLGADKACYLLRELALAVSDLHAAGLVHRDLKPSNIFFESGRIKIGDYSLTKTISGNQHSQHTMTVGSVHYMAPEISQGKYGKSIDVYALGVILYEMLTGHPPHEGESVGEILMKHMQSRPDVSRLDERFREPVLRAMNRNPSQRFQSAQEFAKTVVEVSGVSDLMDSFYPATLSMIGERRAANDQPAASCDTLNETPLAMVDTNTASVPAPPSPAFSPHVRIALASVAIASVYLGTAMWDNRAGIGLFDWLALSGATLLAAGATAYAYRNSTLETNVKGHALVATILQKFSVATLSSLLFFLAAFFATPVEPEGVFVASVALWLAMLIVDWRGFVAGDRQPKLPWKRALLMIVIPAIAVYTLDLEAWCLFSISTTIAVCFGATILSPRIPSQSRVITDIRQKLSRTTLAPHPPVLCRQSESSELLNAQQGA